MFSWSSKIISKVSHASSARRSLCLWCNNQTQMYMKHESDHISLPWTYLNNKNPIPGLSECLRLLAQGRYWYFYFDSKNRRKTQGRLYSLHQCMGPYLEKNRSLQLWINHLVFPILELISLFQLMFFCNFEVLLRINLNHNTPNYHTYTYIYHVYILCNYINIYIYTN